MALGATYSGGTEGVIESFCKAYARLSRTYSEAFLGECSGI